MLFLHMIVRSEVRKFSVIFCGIDFTTATCMVSIPDENDRSLKITKKFFQVGHLYAVREQREEFFILTKSLGLIERTRGKE